MSVNRVLRSGGRHAAAGPGDAIPSHLPPHQHQRHIVALRAGAAQVLHLCQQEHQYLVHGAFTVLYQELLHPVTAVEAHPLGIGHFPEAVAVEEDEIAR